MIHNANIQKVVWKKICSILIKLPTAKKFTEQQFAKKLSGRHFPKKIDHENNWEICAAYNNHIQITIVFVYDLIENEEMFCCVFTNADNLDVCNFSVNIQIIPIFIKCDTSARVHWGLRATTTSKPLASWSKPSSTMELASLNCWTGQSSTRRGATCSWPERQVALEPLQWHLGPANLAERTGWWCL